MTLRIGTIDIETRGVRSGTHLLWPGAKQKGYGVVRAGDRNLGVHRIACERANGPAPSDKPWALHKNECNTPACYEGSHLYWGEAKDNAQDTKAAGHSTGGRAGATHCVNDHEFDLENTYWEPRGWGRARKECRRDAVRRFRAKRKAVA